MSSSAHMATSSGGAIAHNSRENFSHSVVFTDEKNECSHNAKEAFKIYREELAVRSKAYSDRTKQSLQKRTSTKLSTVINLKQHHTLKQLEPIVQFLEKKFDTKVFQVAIHRDEGKLVSKLDGTELYSGKQFFKNPKDDKLYFDKKYTKPIDLNDYIIQKNYHAHIESMGIDSNGKAIRHNQMHKYALKELQDVTAKSLNMQRTFSNEKRYDTHEYKQVGTVKQQEKKKTLATTKDLKAEMKILRDELQQHHAKREDYAKLERFNAELLAEIKAKTLSLEELQEKLSEALQAQKGYQRLNDTLIEKEMDFRARERDLNAIISPLQNENQSLKSENQSLREEVTRWKSAFNKLAKALKDFTNCDKVNVAIEKIKERFAPKQPDLDQAMDKVQSTLDRLKSLNSKTPTSLSSSKTKEETAQPKQRDRGYQR